MGVAGFLGTGNVRPFNLVINRQRVNPYWEAENFDGYKEQVEGDSIWEFYTDSLSITLDKSVLSFLGYDLSNYHQLKNKPAILSYYNLIVFGGVVGELQYDDQAQSLNLELFSYGRIIKDLALQEDLSLYSVNVDDIVNDYVVKVNEQLSDKYTFKININAVNVTDMPFYKGLKRDFTVSVLPTDDVFFLDPALLPVGLFYMLDDRSRFFIAYNTPDTVKESSGFAYFLIEFDDMGNIDRNNILLQKTLVNFRNSDGTEEEKNSIEAARAIAENDKDEGDDRYGVLDVIPSGNGGFYALKRIRFGEFTQLNNLLLIKYDLTDGDVYHINYKSGTAFGDLFRDLCIMTDTVFWVDSGANINITDRSGTGNVTTMSYLTHKTKMINRNAEIEIPDSYLMLPDVRQALIDYYVSFLTGDFYSSTIEAFREEFDFSEFPLMLKDLKVKEAILAGTIKAVQYGKHTIQLETEFRI